MPGPNASMRGDGTSQASPTMARRYVWLWWPLTKDLSVDYRGLLTFKQQHTGGWPDAGVANGSWSRPVYGATDSVLESMSSSVAQPGTVGGSPVVPKAGRSTDPHAMHNEAPRTPNPRVSVVVPTYNRSAMLTRAVRSVLGQTFRDFELLLVDDHSTDDTPVVISRFVDERVRLIRHERNHGQSKALNTGIRAARGEYIAFLDDDDVWLPTKLAAQVAVLDAAPNRTALVHGWFKRIDEDRAYPTKVLRWNMRGDIVEHMLALRVPVPPSLWLMRTAVARALGFDEKVTRCNDADFICRLCEQGWHVDYAPSIVLLKYQHGRGQIMDSTRENLEQHVGFVRQHLTRYADELAVRPAAKANIHLLLARHQFRLSPLKACQSFVSAFLGDAGTTRQKAKRYARWLYHRVRDFQGRTAHQSGKANTRTTVY